MGTGETGTPTKAAKVSTAQDQQASPTSYPEWAAAFQAYYNSGGQPPHGYFPPPVASGPQPHPYMWGPQAMMPPYGTPPPPPYGAIYPHGGIYAHPSMAPGAHPFTQYGMPAATGATTEGTTVHTQGQAMPAGIDVDGTKAIESSKDRIPIKRSKGSFCSLGLLASKGSDVGKGNSSSANGVFSESSGESGSEGSSEASEEDDTQNIIRKRSFEQMTLDAVGGVSSLVPQFTPLNGASFSTAGGNVPGVQSCNTSDAGGTTKLNASGTVTGTLGTGVQDYWSGSTRGYLKGGKRSSASTSSGVVLTAASASLTGTISREGVSAEMWLQDEREVKRQRRKQSNRESARRSRLRKQAECEELGTRVDTLTVENMALRTELTRLSEECKKLTAENTSLLDQLHKSKGGLGDEDQDGLSDDNMLAVQTVGLCKVLDVSKAGSPSRPTARPDENLSYDSTGKVSPSLDSGTHPESIAAS